MSVAWGSVILNIILSVFLYLKYKPTPDWKRGVMSVVFTTAFYTLVLYTFSNALENDLTALALFITWSISFGVLLTIIYEIFRGVLNGSKISKKDGQIVPIVVVVIAVLAMFVIERDVTYFTLILAGVGLMLVSWLRPGLLVDKANLLSLLYAIPLVILFLFVTELLSSLQYSSAQYLPFTLLGVRLEHILLAGTYALYVLALYQTGRRPKSWKLKIVNS